MAKDKFTIGDEVITARFRGLVIDICATPSGQFIFGVEASNGEVAYFTPKGIRHVE